MARDGPLSGGSGYIRGFEIERLYRDARIAQIREANHQTRRTIIARDMPET